MPAKARNKGRHDKENKADLRSLSIFIGKGTPETRVDKGVPGRVPGDALNTRVSRQPFLKRPVYKGFKAFI